jgi:hypothetical protein
MTLGGVEPTKPSTMRQNNGLIVVCAGPSGAGKTSLLDDPELIKEYGPIAVLDVDGKAHVLRDHPGLDIYPCHTWKQLDSYVQDLEAHSLHPEYKLVCVDGLALAQTKLAWGHHEVEKIDNPQLRQTAFGKANLDMVNLNARLRILAERGTYIIYNIWAVFESSKTDAMERWQPDLTGTLLTRFIGVLDLVVFLEPNAPPKPYPPVMRTGGSQLYGTKTAVSPESPLRDMPQTIYNPSWKSLFDSYTGAPWPTAKHSKGA